MRYFIPILGNGGNSGKISWVISMLKGLSGLEVHLSHAEDSHADRGMNKIANDFLASDCPEMLVIDADIEFEPEHIKRLLEHNVPLCYGIYPKKEEATSPCLATFSDGPRNVEGSELKWLFRAGRGFMRVRREVLEAMKEDNGGPALRYHNHGRVEWCFFQSGPILAEGVDEQGFQKREWISEDWMFCDRANALGIKTLADPRIALAHDGNKMYRFSKEQTGKIDKWMTIPGWFSKEDAICMERIADDLNIDSRYVEVGCHKGRSLACLIHHTNLLGVFPEIVTVDKDLDAAEVFANIKAAEIYIEEDSITFCKADSLTAASAEAAENIDAVFIDADHSEEAVRADIAAWLPKVKPGGIIAGHDADYPSVRAAVTDAFGDNFETIGRCWFARKSA